MALVTARRGRLEQAADAGSPRARAALHLRLLPMIEDDVRNLEAPKALGMATVWLCHAAGARAPAWVDRRITRLMAFLDEVLGDAQGVTGIRIMWGSPLHRSWARDVEAGKLAGPRIYMAGSIIDGPQKIWPNSTAVGTEAEARAAVTDTKAMGADFVKVYSRLTREGFFTIADEAKKQGIPIAGHVPGSVTVREASDAGQLTIEHQTGVLLSSSSREDELRGMTRGQAVTPALIRQLNQGMIGSFDAAKAADLAAHLRKNGTWLAPTLTVLRNMANLDDPAITSDARLKYMPASIRTQWDPKNDFRLQSRTPEDVAIAKQTYAKNKEVTGILAKAGVGTLAGTDVINPYCFPGFSLHDELVLLVEAGLTPMQALQAATLNVAKMMGREAQVGTIEAGKLADAVLLDADPLADIRNTTRIRAVLTNGKLLDRAALDKLLADAEAAARK